MCCGGLIALRAVMRGGMFSQPILTVPEIMPAILVREAPGVIYRPFESPGRLTCLFLWKKDDTRPLVTQFADFTQS